MGMGEEEGAGRLIDAALRQGPIGGSGGGGGGGGGEEESAAASSSPASLGAGRREERPSVRALAQRLRGCLEVRVRGEEAGALVRAACLCAFHLLTTSAYMHMHVYTQEPAPLPADFTRLFSQGRLHSLAPDPALLARALDLYARLNVDRAKVRGASRKGGAGGWVGGSKAGLVGGRGGSKAGRKDSRLTIHGTTR